MKIHISIGIHMLLLIQCCSLRAGEVQIATKTVLPVNVSVPAGNDRTTSSSLLRPFGKLDPKKTVQLRQLSAILQIEQNQQQNSQGVSLKLVVVNQGTADLEIDNPLDSLDVMLTDKEGWPLDFPPFTRRLMSELRGSAAKRISLPITVETVALNGKTLTWPQIEAFRFKVPARARYEIRLNVKSILPLREKREPLSVQIDPGNIHARASLENELKADMVHPRLPIELPTGDYQLRIGFGLTDSAKPDTQIYMRSEMVSLRYLPAGETATDFNKHVAEPLAADFPIQVGKTAPSFTAEDMDGKKWTLADLRGKKNLLLTFFPKCFTSGCANHLSSLRDYKDEFDSADTQILAVSVDPAEGDEGQIAFAKEWRLNFPLVPDTKRQLCKLYGAVQTETDLATRQSVFIDKEGIVRFVDRQVRVRMHGTDVLAQMRILGLITNN